MSSKSKKEYDRKAHVRWRLKDPVRYRLSRRRAHYPRVTLIRQLVFWEDQRGCCAICKKQLTCFFNAHLDHCHGSGKMRGFLCGTCNRGIGQLQDSADLCRAAADYLAANENR